MFSLLTSLLTHFKKNFIGLSFHNGFPVASFWKQKKKKSYFFLALLYAGFANRTL